MAGKRKILKPDPLPNEAHVAGANGCRHHYEGTVNEVIVDGINDPIAQNFHVHFKDLKGRSGQPSDLPVALAKLEVVNTELFGFLSGANRRSRGFLVVDPGDRRTIVGVATEQIANFKDYKRNPNPQFWGQFDPIDVAKAGMRIAIMADDDNHKENLGVVDPPNVEAPIDAAAQVKPLRVIDHDMCFYDQIFSRIGKGSRNYLHPFSEDRTYLSSADIDNFPNTTNFRPHYWWSKPGLRKKAYKSYDKKAMEDFSDVNKYPNFQKAAYSQLFSFLLIPKALFETMLLQHIDRNDPLFPLVLNAWIEQQSTLRTAALGSEKFRAAVAANMAPVEDNRPEYEADFAKLVNEYHEGIQAFTHDEAPPTPPNEIAKLCADFVSTNITNRAPQDTPLHAAIRSGHFRYDETMKWHGKDLHRKNRVAEGIEQTPLDLAIALGLDAANLANAALDGNPAEAKAQWEKVIYFQRTAQFLVNQGAVKPVNYVTLLNLRRPIGVGAAALHNLLSRHDRLQDRLAHHLSYNHVTEEIRNREDLLEIWVDTLSNREHSKVPVALTHWFFANLDDKMKDPELTKEEREILKKEAPETHSNILLDALELSLAKLRDNTDLTLKMKKNAAILAFKTVLPHLKPQSSYGLLQDRYELLLMPQLPDGPHQNPDPNKIYINQVTREYTVCGIDGLVKRGTLPVEFDLINLTNNLNNMEFKKKVLAFTTNVGHTRQDDFERIINILNKDEFKFMQQLSSRLEIVRRCRGLYGVTSTYKTIAHSINKRLNEIVTPQPVNNQLANAQPANAQVPAANPPVDKTFIMHLQIKCSEKMHTFFARHTKLVRQLKPLEAREVIEQLSAPAA